MSYAATHILARSLRLGWQTVDVRESQGYLLVSLNGVRVLNVHVSLPGQAWLGFTGATGASYEWNEIKAANVTVS